MDNWERFNETSLPPKESFYSELKLEDISDKDYSHAQKVWEEFGIRNLGEYHDLYVQTSTLLLADVYEKFRDKCIEIYGLDPSHFLYLRYSKANNKYMKNYDKSTESSYLMYLDANNLYGWAMSETLPVNAFKWENDPSKFNENFIKYYYENSDVRYFFEVDIEYPKQ